MGTFNANILPASTGLNIGSALQAWNLYGNNLVLPNIVAALGTVQGTPAIAISSSISMVTMTLSGNTSPSISGTPAIVIFAISQNGAGGYTFTWPAGTVNGMTIGSAANQISYQLFVWDGAHLTAMAPGLLNP